MSDESQTISDAQIDALVRDANAGTPFAEAPTEPAPAPEAEPEPTPEPDKPAAEPDKPAAEPPKAKEFAPLVKLEQKLRTREAALKEREAELATQLARVEELAKLASAPKKYEDPLALLKEHGFSIEDATTAWAIGQGIDLPPEAKAKAEAAKQAKTASAWEEKIAALEKRFSDLTATLESKEAKRAEEAATMTRRRAGEAAVSYIHGAAEQYPHCAILARTSPERFAADMLAVADAGATEGRGVTFEEAAAYLEQGYRDELAPFIELYKADQPKPVPKQKKSAPAPTATPGPDSLADREPDRRRLSPAEEFEREQQAAIRELGPSIWRDSE